MRTSHRSRKIILIVLLAGALLLLGGCEALFTYSPFTGLQRNPSSLSPAQRITYAQDALASGDKAAMQAAYDAVKNDPGTTADYTTAELGIELSGLPTLIIDAIADPSAVLPNGDATSVADFLAAHPDLQPSLVMDAGARLQALDAGGFPITANDRVLGAIGLALAASAGTTPAYDLGAPGVDLTAAKSLLTPLVGDGSAGDMLTQYLNSV